MQITRSGILAKVVSEFVSASASSKEGREAQKNLLAYLAECREGVKKRGDFAVKSVPSRRNEL
jgi:hypothetical protein